MRATPSWPRRWRRIHFELLVRHLRPLRLQPGAAAVGGPRRGGRGPQVREQRHLLSVHPGHRPDHGSGHVRRATTPTSWPSSSRRRAAAAAPRTTSRSSARRWQVGGPVAHPGHRAVVQGLGRESTPASRSRRPCCCQAVSALQYGDLLMMCLYRTRPYEVEPGSANRLFDHWMAECKGQLARRPEARRVQAHGRADRGGLRHAAACRARARSRASAWWARSW